VPDTRLGVPSITVGRSRSIRPGRPINAEVSRPSCTPRRCAVHDAHRGPDPEVEAPEEAEQSPEEQQPGIGVSAPTESRRDDQVADERAHDHAAQAGENHRQDRADRSRPSRHLASFVDCEHLGPVGFAGDGRCPDPGSEPPRSAWVRAATTCRGVRARTVGGAESRGLGQPASRASRTPDAVFRVVARAPPARITRPRRKSLPHRR
jgi:hypothetical protein